jgi:CBS-domain-containing membrane protein
MTAAALNRTDKSAAGSPLRSRRIGEIMGWAVHTVDARTPVGVVLRMAEQRKIHHVPVLERGSLEGIVCVCDLWGVRGDLPVKLRMRSPVVTIPTQMSPPEAALVMRMRDVGALPVLYHGFLIGIVTAGDLDRAGLTSVRQECDLCHGHHHVRPIPGALGWRCIRCQGGGT